MIGFDEGADGVEFEGRVKENSGAAGLDGSTVEDAGVDEGATDGVPC